MPGAKGAGALMQKATETEIEEARAWLARFRPDYSIGSELSLAVLLLRYRRRAGMTDGNLERPPTQYEDPMKLMFHDDDCGALLDSEGKCRKCGFHPDGQSVSFREASAAELEPLRAAGQDFLGPFREPVG